MAETRKITIEITQSGEKGQDHVLDKLNNSGDTKATGKASSESLVSTILVNQAFNQVKGIVKNVATYSINKHFTLKENYLMQQALDNTINTISRVGSFALTMVGGAKLGSAGGPWGAIIGGTIASVGWGINEGFNIYKKLDQSQMALNQTNAEIVFSRTRAGLTNESRGTIN